MKAMKAMTAITLLSIASSLATGRAQAASVAGPCTAIIQTRAWVDGDWVDGVDVIFDRDGIVHVGLGAPGAAACDRIDGGALWVTPGFIDVHTQLGLTEVGAAKGTVDSDLMSPLEHPSKWVRASVRAEQGYNPRSTAIPVARLGGVTSAISAPSGGVISGYGFWADLVGGPQAQSIVATAVGLYASTGASDGGSRATRLHLLDTVLKESAEWAKHKKRWARGQTRAFIFPWVTLSAMAPVMTGAAPLVVGVNRAADIEALLAQTAGSDLRLVIDGGAEAHLVADALAARKIPVIVDPLRYGPGSFDMVFAEVQGPARLHAAGVTVLLSTRSAHSVRKLRQLAGNAVRGGLPYEAAMAAITSAAAETFGQPHYGRLTVGSVPNIAIWSGDPFEPLTQLKALYLRGTQVPLVSRQTMLRDRYRKVGE